MTPTVRAYSRIRAGADWRFVELFFAAAVFSACVPFPHTEAAAPALSGVVTLAGTPKSGLRVVLSPHCHSSTPAAPCGRSGTTTRTDDEGRFAFPALAEFGAFKTLGESRRCWALCVEHNMILREVYRTADLPRFPDAAEISCELSDASIELPSGRGLCRYHERK